MTENKIPQTNAELDSLVAAWNDRRVIGAAGNLIQTLCAEIKLPNSDGNTCREFHLIAEAVVLGVPPEGMVAHFAREEAESRRRAQEAHDLMDAASALLSERRTALQASDSKLGRILRAIEVATVRNIAAVRAQEREINVPVKHANLVNAAIAAGIDPAKIIELKPPRLDKWIENLKRHMMGSAAKPIEAVLNDPLRRLDGLPDWVRGMLDQMADTDPHNRWRNEAADLDLLAAAVSVIDRAGVDRA